MTLLARLRAARLKRPLDDYAAFYSDGTADVAAFQLDRLNRSWSAALVRSPFARRLKEQLGLPLAFDSWNRFEDQVPITDKSLLRGIVEQTEGDNSTGRLIWRSTGGSSAEPFRFPIWPDERRHAGLDMWLGRRRLGIAPSDRLFLLWGHAHLLGSGARGAFNAAKRRLSDRLLGYVRHSAYDLSAEGLLAAGKSLLESRPHYVIGYSTALDRFARVNGARREAIAALGLKAVIATAEALPGPESRQRIESCFGAPLAMEYGAVETGPIGYENPFGGQSGYSTFWAHHRLERFGGGPGPDELAVTSLYPRALPLLRYRLRDLIEARESVLTRLDRVIGRCNEQVRLADGAVIHSEAFSHCLRDSPIDAFQIVAPEEGELYIRYEAKAELPQAALGEIRSRLARINPVLSSTEFRQIPRLELSPAGKHRMVVAY